MNFLKLDFGLISLLFLLIFFLLFIVIRQRKGNVQKEEGDLLNHQNVTQQGIQNLLNVMLQDKNQLQNQLNQQVNLQQQQWNQLQKLQEQQTELLQQNNKIFKTLSNSHSAGRYGEIQLKRILEISGMTEYIDFDLQANETNLQIRPDAVIKLPQNKCVIIDAKVPLQHFLRLLECQQEADKNKIMQEHVKSIKQHIFNLSKRKYTEKKDNSVEITVLFLPSEALLHTAIANESEILHYAMEYNVCIATPMTLISILRVIHQLWQQYSLAQNLDKIINQHKEMLLIYKQSNDYILSMERLLNNVNKEFGQLKQAFSSEKINKLASLSREEENILY